MATFEIKPEYKREVIEVELAQVAGATFQLLNSNLKMTDDSVEIEDILNTYLGNFIKTYDETHKKNDELNPADLIATTITHNKDDLLNFRKSVQGIDGLLEGLKDKITPANYTNYAKSLKTILVETDLHLSRLDGNGEKKAA
jgi:hypothetical protein